MKANELRIGNIVLYNDKVIQIAPKAIYEFYYIGETHANSKLDRRDYKPVPLSEEWLIKAGFEQRHGSNYYEKNGIGLITGYAVDGSFVCGNSFGARHCHFYEVHQLQNLYFALTGRELEFKL